MRFERPFALTLLGGLAILSLSPARAANPFDGSWSVEVITEQGDCDKAYRYLVAVRNGQVSYAGRENFDVSGQVAANGTVRGTIARGQDRASVSGRLAGGSGSGRWTASGARTCSGRWNAERRG